MGCVRRWDGRVLRLALLLLFFQHQISYSIMHQHHAVCFKLTDRFENIFVNIELNTINIPYTWILPLRQATRERGTGGRCE